MSQTQLDDLTAGAGDGANLGLIANVLGNKGGEGRWESMRLLSAGVFGLEIATLSPQRERPFPSSPRPLPPSGQSPPSLAAAGQEGWGSEAPPSLPLGPCGGEREPELSLAPGHQLRGRGGQ